MFNNEKEKILSNLASLNEEVEEIKVLAKSIATLSDEISNVREALGGLILDNTSAIFSDVNFLPNATYRSKIIKKIEEKISLLEGYLSIKLITSPQTKKYVRVKK